MRTSDSAISGGASSWRISVDEGGVKMGLYGRHYDMVTQGRSKRKRLLIESLNAFGGMWYVCLFVVLYTPGTLAHRPAGAPAGARFDF